MEEKWYLKAAHAPDFENPADYRLYRFFEIIPGALMWTTLLGTILASWLAPVGASFFIIAFDIYWLLKTVFLSLHLRMSFSEMRKNVTVNWREKLNAVRHYSGELKLQSWQDIRHLVIIPFYQEEYEVISGGLAVILKSNYPTENLFIVIAREAVRLLIDAKNISHEHVIVSSFDVDTEVAPEYFSILTYRYLMAEKPLRSSFQPIPVYNNNIWDAPAFSRVVATSGTFWQMMQQARPERLATFSSHSIPLVPLVQMDYWHTNMVSEDSRIFWQALVYFDGDYRVVPLNYPVSMDANLAGNWRQTAKNVYRQQRRWIWGVENIPYLLFGFIKNKNIPLRKKLYFGFNQLEGFWSIGTNAIMIFVLGWLPVLIGGSAFGVSVLAHNLPRVTRWLMVLAMIGLATSAVYSLKLLPPRPPHRPAHHYFWMVIQWLLIPFTLIGFGSIPGIDAITRLMLGKYMGFWVTPKSRLTKDIS